MKFVYLALILVALLVAGLVASSVALAPVAVPSVTPQATTAIKGGGGKIITNLPADFPSNFPLPAGTVRASTGTAPKWAVALIVDSGVPESLQAARNLYLPLGYTETSGPGANPVNFQNPAYTIQVVAANRDHSATSTDVNVYVTRR